MTVPLISLPSLLPVIGGVLIIIALALFYVILRGAKKNTPNISGKNRER